jgi:hypothetical protein
MIAARKELSWIKASSLRLFLHLFNRLIFFSQLFESNSKYPLKKMLSRRQLNLIMLLEKAFPSFNLLFNIVKLSIEKIPEFYLFPFSQLLLEISSKFVYVESSSALGIFEKILRKNCIFKKNNFDCNALNSNAFRTWTTSNTLKILLNDFENSIFFFRQFIDKFKNQIQIELNCTKNSHLFPFLLRLVKTFPYQRNT